MMAAREISKKGKSGRSGMKVARKWANYAQQLGNSFKMLPGIKQGECRCCGELVSKRVCSISKIFKLKVQLFNKMK